jgi:hypothetical protein
MAMTVKKSTIFRNVTPLSLVDRYQGPGETSCLHVQGISGSPLLPNVGTYLGNTKTNQIPEDSNLPSGCWLENRALTPDSAEIIYCSITMAR